MEAENIKETESKQGHTYWQWTLTILVHGRQMLASISVATLSSDVDVKDLNENVLGVYFQFCYGNHTWVAHGIFSHVIHILANMTVFSYGLDYGWISPTAKILQSEKSPAGQPLSDNMLSWIASSLTLGAVFTVPLYSYIADRFGRRTSVITIAVPQTISWLIRLLFSSGPSLVISRMFSGFAAGGCFNIVVMYIKEISQDNNRGTLASMLVMFQNIGIFVMYVMGAYLDYYTILWIVFAIPIVTGILFYKAPESPAYLIKRGKIQEAIITVAFLRGRDENDKIVLDEVTKIRNEEDYFKTQPNIALVDIVKNPIWRRGIFVLIVLIGVRGLNGAFAITTYASTILKLTGAKLSFSAETLTLSIPAVMILGSAVGTICVERMGRKTLNIAMLSISACSLLCIAVCMLMKQHGVDIPGWLPVLAMMVTSWALAAGVSPVPYIIMAEMFNFQIRARVLGFIGTFAWFVTFIPIFGLMPLSNAVGLHTTFFAFAGINIFGVLFSAYFLPETKGKSVDQIEKDIAFRIGLEKSSETNTYIPVVNYVH